MTCVGLNLPLKSLHWAKRPVLIFGAGMRHAAHDARELARLLGIPVAPTWGALDLFPSDDPLTVGAFGTHGTQHANLAIQNSDWLLSVGSRLDTKATSTPANLFSPLARKFIVDIDASELAKFAKLGIQATTIEQDAALFLREMINQVLAVKDHEGSFPDFTGWLDTIDSWRSVPQVPEIISRLSDETPEDAIICCDTGCTVAWICQAWKFKKGQRLIHAWNQTPMGYGLPAAIGAHYATGKPVLLITGDGSFMMNLGELATAKGLPIRIVLLENDGHAMCRQTQREWFGGTYPATSRDGGLKFPDFTKVATAFGVDMTVYRIDPDADVHPKRVYGEPLAPVLEWKKAA